MEPRVLHRALPVLLVALALGACATQTAVAQEGGSDCRTVDAGLSCEVFCLDGMPRDPHATITWKTGALPDPLSLELTVYKRGFAMGEVAVFDGVGRGDQRQRDPKQEGRPAEYRGKDERDLTWMDVLLVSEPSIEPSLTLRMLEPNLTYRLRLVNRSGERCVASEPTTCQPVPCIADWVTEDER